jgi:taurine dioxygenase
MSFTIQPSGDALGAIVTDIDLGNAQSAETVAALNDALHTHIALCFRDQDLTPATFAAAGRRFGEPIVQTSRHLDLPEHPEVGTISSESVDVHGDGRKMITGTTWHTDHSFTARPPKATTLYGVTIPTRGGDTSFCNMRAVYAALPNALRARVDGLRGVHCYESHRAPGKLMQRSAAEIAATPDVTHPLARTYPPTGEKALYLSTTRLDRIVDMDLEASDELIDELMTYADRPEFHYHHQWRAGDMVIWDNRCAMHHANADYGNEKRVLHRVLIEGEVPI